MAIRFFLISASCLLALLMLSPPGVAQEGSPALEHLDWLPAGSYIGFLHIDRTQLDAEDTPLLIPLLKELDILQLHGDLLNFERLTVAMVEDLDAIRQRQQSHPERKLRTDELWFFDEIVIAHYFDSQLRLKEAVKRGTATAVEPV